MAGQATSCDWTEAAINPALIPETRSGERRGERVLEVREILWGDTLQGVTQYRKGFRQVLFGEGRSCRHFLPAELLPRDPFPLLRADRDGPVLGLTHGMEGYLERRGRRIPLAEVCAGYLGMPSLLLSSAEQPAFDLPLEPDDQVLLALGPVTLFIRQIARTRPVRESLVRAVNWTFAAILLLSLAGVGGVLGTASLHGYSVLRPARSVPDRFAEKILLATPRPDRPEPEPQPELKPRQALPRPSDPPPGDAGRIGTEASQVVNARGTSRRALRDTEIAQSHGILEILQRSAGNADLDAVFGGGLSGDLEKNLGTLHGPEGVDRHGTNGLALYGTDTGGGGHGIALSGIATYGRGRRGLPGYDPGAGTRLKRRRIEIPDGPAFTGEVRGSLPRAIVDRVLKRHYAQLRHCYQLQLVTKPHLEGKVKVEFIIGNRGRVREAYVLPSSTTLEDEQVQDCVCRVIQRIKFPRPKHGIVVVRYPLLFASQG